MFDYKSNFTAHIDSIKSEGRYREFIEIKRQVHDFPFATAKVLSSPKMQNVVIWCLNDYLGMSRHHKVLSAAREAIDLHGVGSGGTRNIGGNNTSIIELELEISSLHQKESALVFTSGYVANDATLSSLARIMPDIVFFSDEENHASIISGIRNSRAEKYIYKHRDISHLEELLKNVDFLRPKIIVFESVYSMNGLKSPIKDICNLARKYNCLTFIDEVHTVGLYSHDGSGVASEIGMMQEIDIIQGTLGKAYGTIGGYIAARKEIIDAIRLTSSGFIFTTSLPPVITAAACASIKHLKSSGLERKAHQIAVSKVKKALDAASINYLKNDSHIIPIIIGDAIKAEMASKILLEHYNIYVQHINFPTVARGTERLRITPTGYHTDTMIQNLIMALINTFQQLDIKYPVYAA